MKSPQKQTPAFDFANSDRYIQSVKTTEPRPLVAGIVNSRVLHHILFWSFLFAVMSLTPEARGMPFLKLVIHNLGHLSVLVLPVYAHFYILEKFFLNKRFGIYIGLLFLVLISSGFAADFIFRKYFSYQEGLFAAIYFVGFAILISSSAKLFKKAVQQKLKLQEVESKQLQTELALLKAQVNPHFLFNTLNNLFGMARNQDPGTAEGISRLSHLMRYMIHDSQVERIELDKEIEQVSRLIELQKLRFSGEDDIEINFQVKGQTDKFQVPPMLFIPFVENAFKHGISLDTSSFVHIELKTQEGHLEFCVKNSTHSSRQDYSEPDTGLGLGNVKRRLELLFPDRYKLNIQESEETFEIYLSIEL